MLTSFLQMFSSDRVSMPPVTDFTTFTPRPFALIWVNPLTIRQYCPLGRRMTGKIHDGDWDIQASPVMDNIKIKACVSHWKDGVPWHETGIYEHMEQLIARRGTTDGCSNRKDVEERYRSLDRLYNEVRQNGGLTPAYLRLTNCPPGNERNGICIHIGRHREAIMSGSGHHRFGIALALKLQCIPAQIGVVHPLAIVSERGTQSRNVRRFLAKHNACETATSKHNTPMNTKQQTRVGYQAGRMPDSKYDLISKSIDLSRVTNLLDIGCNQGRLTKRFFDEGILSVGLDIKPYFLDEFEQKTSPAFGVLAMNSEWAARLPSFDVIMLLSVHHQWISHLGNAKAASLVNALAEKSMRYFVIEFAARASKYGFTEPPFKDNDEKSVRAYASQWLDQLPVNGARQYIGKNPEHLKKEPYRYLYVIHRQ